ncbi:MAG: hypothetical protein ACRDY3_08055 [Acidimicrobiales bacterium]
MSGLAAVGLVASGAAFAPGAGAATHHHRAKVVIATRHDHQLGTILVSRGRALYFIKGHGSCTGSCLQVWKAVVLPRGVKHATAGTGVKRSKLGVDHDAAGRQVTYGRKALYWFTADGSGGEVNGNGVKDTAGTWAVAVTARAKSTAHVPSTSPSSTTTSGAGGYGY